MADNKTQSDGRDDVQVDINDPNEVEQVHSNFPGLSHQQVKDAIQHAGPWRNEIHNYIKEHHKV